jgi:hypothetical protein
MRVHPTVLRRCAVSDAVTPSRATEPEVSALAINVALPERLQWRDVRRGEEYVLTSVTVRLLADGSLAAKAYGRPAAGGRGGYTSFRVPDRPEIVALLETAATRAAEKWSTHSGLVL